MLAKGEAMMEKLNISITSEMLKRLEEERKKRALDSVPETIRYILADYLAKQ
jgi:metal-responsive CopG/Arc/MetJ family transcriptional regulator